MVFPQVRLFNNDHDAHSTRCYFFYSYDTNASTPFIRHEPFAYHSSKITEPALINATTTSFGSICLGGLFIAIVQFSSFALRNTAKVRNRSYELLHLGTLIVHILTTRSFLCYACGHVEIEGPLLPSLCAPCHILRPRPRSSRELQQLHPYLCWHHRRESVCSSAICQQNLPQELALGPSFRYVCQLLLGNCMQFSTRSIYSTDPWLFCFAWYFFRFFDKVDPVHLLDPFLTFDWVCGVHLCNPPLALTVWICHRDPVEHYSVLHYRILHSHHGNHV